MRIFQRIVKESGGNQPCGVSHVNHEHRSHPVCYGTHPGIIPFPGICRSSAHDQSGLFAKCNLLHHVIVDPTGLFPDTVSYGPVEDAG